MKKPFIALVLACSLVLGGCSSTGTNTFGLAFNTSVKWNVVLAAALAVYVIYDPLAPNWDIEEAKLPDDSYHLSMTMKRFHTGGSGEALQILKRRAALIQRENGFGDYYIAEYTEGIDSRTLGARRVAEGVVRFAKRDEADSFALNTR